MDNILEIDMELSPDMAEFTGLGSSVVFGEVCMWLNTYVDRHGLANGPLPLIGGNYPGPSINFDDCLNYLFKPYLAEMNIREGASVKYSEFKGLCLKHMKNADL